jgi:Complex I intermediate-associated protein 30 (CIA30)
MSDAYNSLKNSNCLRQFSSYRASFELIRGKWTTVRLPWKAFEGFGRGAAENAFDPSSLRRIGVVAIGRAMDVTLALSSIRFSKKLG